MRDVAVRAILARPTVWFVLLGVALPIRLPISVGSLEANLLLPLYAVILLGVVAWVWARVREEVAAGRQCYVVCPRVDASTDDADDEEALPIAAGSIDLFASALALLVSPRLGETTLALAGVLLGYATVVKVSNGFLAAAALGLVALRLGPKRALPLAAAGAAFAPLVAAYWPRGYPEIPNVPGFSLGQAGRSWADSLIFDPRTLLVLLPLAVLGAFALRPWVAALLVAGPATNAGFYTFYEHTPMHPRFLYAALPALFVLQAAGAWLGIRKVAGAVRKPGL